MRGTWRVSSAVTVGLPSRSPPIHEPQRRNAPTRAGRVPVRPASVASTPSTAPAGFGPRAAARLGLDPVERPVEGPVDARHDPEERLVEEGQGRPDFVDRARRQPSDRRRPPQDADLLAQPPADLGVVGWPRAADRPAARRAGSSAAARSASSAAAPRSDGRSGPGEMRMRLSSASIRSPDQPRSTSQSTAASGVPSIGAPASGADRG